MKALVLVDIQHDFLPTGALPVPRGDEVIAVAHRLLPLFDIVVATQDWHPAKHGSFAANHANRVPGEVVDLDGIAQVLWPNHCVQETPGAELAFPQTRGQMMHVVRKGTHPRIDSYSGFFDNGHTQQTGLEELLRSLEVDTIYVMGLATDYCVKYTALDARMLGFTTFLIEDGCRGIDLTPGDIAQAITEMQQAGVRVIQSEELLARVAAPFTGACDG